MRVIRGGIMPKSVQNNSVDKLNKQIKSLESQDKSFNKYKDIKEEVPVLNRKDFTNKYPKKSTKNEKYNKNKIRDNIIVDNKKYKKESKPIHDKIITIPDKKEKSIPKKEAINKKDKEEGLSSEETIKFRKLENEMHSLYDKVNDVVDDIENTKTIELDQDIIDKAINKTNFEKNISKISKDIDDIDQENLNKIVNTLAIIFGVLLFLFLIFIIFISVV